MDYGLQGKTALITGTASQVGMGKAICLTLAKEGCTIISTDMDLEGAQQTVEAVIAMGGKGIALKVDVTEGSEVTEMVKIVLKEFGKIDILINNAAKFNRAKVIDLKVQDFDRVWNTNIRGAFMLTKFALQYMIIQNQGTILSISSTAGKRGSAGSAAYTASKFA